MSNLTSFDKAIELIKENTQTLKQETISIHNCLNRVLATDVKATISNPSFNNSAVDGIGITKEVLLNLQKNNTPLTIKKTILAGDTIEENLKIKDTECLHIMTGSPVPNNISTIFLIEDTIITNNTALIQSPLKDNQNIRYAGEDYNKEDILIKKSTKLKFNNISLLASSGISEVSVFKKPKAAIFTTGKETLEVGSKVSLGKIYNSNIFTMKNFLENLGFEVVTLKNVNDTIDELKNNINEAKKLNVDIIVSSGAVSMGVEDIVNTYLSKNTKVLYNGLKIRPGKPSILSVLENNILYFALPGNPVSTSVGLYFLVQAYYNFSNKIDENSLKAVIDNNYNKKPGFTFFFRGKYYTENAIIKVKILNKQGSHIVSALSEANCFVKINEETTNILKNSIVDIYEIK